MTIEYTDPATTSSNGGKQPTKAPVRVFSDNGIDEEIVIETIDEDDAHEPTEHPGPTDPDTPNRPARLTEIELKLAKSVSKLSARLNKAYSVNERLFGQQATDTETENTSKIKGIGQKGLLNAIDRRMYELEALLQSLDEELDKIETIA